MNCNFEKNSILKYVPIVIAIAQWALTTTFGLDRLFFTYNKITRYFVITKIGYLLFLLLVWTFIFKVVQKCKEGNKEYKRACTIFTVYFSILMVLLTIVWPGTWGWDDLLTLQYIQNYDSYYPWQHIFTGFYQTVLLQVIPIPAGIILIQNVIVAVCVSFSITKLEGIYNLRISKNKIADLVVKILPFLMPPVLMYQFSGYRFGLYVHLELVAIVILIEAIYNKAKWSWKYLFLFSAVAVIISVWRTESFLYIPLFCIIVYFLKDTVISRKKKIACILVMISGFLGMNYLQKIELGDNNYEVISLMRPCVELVRVADPISDEKELAAIDKVADLSVIYSYPDSNGEYIYWNTNCVRTLNSDPTDDYTREDYSKFTKAIVKLSLKYPKTVIVERINLFIQASGITGKSSTNVWYAAYMFDEGYRLPVAEEFSNTTWKAKTSLFPEFRLAIVFFLGGSSARGESFGVLRILVWNTLFPILFLTYEQLTLLEQKKWLLSILCLSVFIKLPIVILTEPSPWLMYYLSLYFLGYVIVVYRIIQRYSMKYNKTSTSN